MVHFIIAYDLRKLRDYEPLWAQLRAWGAVRLLESLWVVCLSGVNTGDICAALRRITDKDDGIAVIQLIPGSEWSSFEAKPAGVNWLKRNIRSF